MRTSILGEAQRTEIIKSIKSLIQALSSPEVAIDERHAPKLYARFLETLLEEQIGGRDEPMPQSDSQSGTPAESQPTTSGGEQSSTETDSKTHKPRSDTPVNADSEGPQTPSISLEYAPIGGEPHVQVLQDATGRTPSTENYHTLLNPLSNFTPQYGHDERFSTTSSTVGGQGDDGETSTQHGGNERPGHEGIGGQLGQDEMLASMRLLSNPQFFNHMMMPPYNPARWGENAMAMDATYPLAGPETQNDQQRYSNNGQMSGSDMYRPHHPSQ
jgi:hypothetical protein